MASSGANSVEQRALDRRIVAVTRLLMVPIADRVRVGSAVPRDAQMSVVCGRTKRCRVHIKDDWSKVLPIKNPIGWQGHTCVRWHDDVIVRRRHEQMNISNNVYVGKQNRGNTIGVLLQPCNASSTTNCLRQHNPVHTRKVKDGWDNIERRCQHVRDNRPFYH
jgi:hypothetical protein